MKDKKYLNQEECLNSEDALVSPNGLYYAVLHSNGSICFYIGARGLNHYYTLTPGYSSANGPHLCIHKNGMLCLYPSNPKGGTQVWTSKKYGPWGNHQLWLEDDGTLVVYRGVRGGPIIWRSNSENKIKDLINIRDIEYGLENAVIDNPEILSLSECEYTNETGIEQKVQLKYDKSITISIKHSFTQSYTVSITLNIGYVPSSATGGASFNLELKFIGTWTKEEETTKIETITYSNTTDLIVKPYTRLEGSILLNNVTFHVPFTTQCDVIFENGAVVSNYTLDGTCTSNGTHDLRIKVKEFPLARPEMRTNEISGDCEDIIIL